MSKIFAYVSLRKFSPYAGRTKIFGTEFIYAIKLADKILLRKSLLSLPAPFVSSPDQDEAEPIEQPLSDRALTRVGKYPIRAATVKPYSEADFSKVQMRTICCTLKLWDGEIVTAKASSDKPWSEVPVEYSGAVDRFVDCYERANLPFLEFLFAGRAANLKAELNMVSEGNYDEPWSSV